MSLAGLRKHAAALVLVPLAGIAGYFAFFSGETTITSKEKEDRERMLLPAWRRDDVATLKVTRGGDAYTLVRARTAEGSSTWTLEGAGGALSADDQAVDRFLGTIEYATPRRTVPPDGVDRVRFGLDAPRGTVSIVMGKLTFEIRVGAEAPDAGGVYVEVPDRGVFVVSRELADGLLPDEGALRSKSFVPYFSIELQAMRISGEGGEKKFVRAAFAGGRGSGFLVDDARRARANGDVLDQVFVSLGKMTVKTFLDEKDVPKDAPRITIVLEPKAGEPATIDIHGACPGTPEAVVAVRRSASGKAGDMAACVPGIVVPALVRPLDDFVDRHLVGASVDEIVELSLSRGTEKIEIARSGAGFKMRSPRDGTVPAERGNAYLVDLVGLTGRFEAADDASVALEGEPATIVVASHGGVAPGGGEADRREELVVRARADKKLRVERKEDGAVLVVEPGDGRILEVSDVLVRDLVLVKSKPDAVTEVAVTDRSGTTQKLVRAGATIDLVAPKGKNLTADVDWAVTLFGKLSQLSAVRWVADKDDGSFGLDAPRFTVTAKIDGKEHVLVIGTRTLDGAYASLSSVPGVFVIPRDVEEAIDRKLVSRMAMVVPLDTVTRITFETGTGRRVVLVRDGKAFRVDPPDTKVDVSDLVDGLGRIVPASAVTVGPPEKSQGFDKPHLRIVLEGPEKTILELGARDAFRGVAGLYARRTDVDATYLVEQGDVRALDDALGEP